MNTEFLITGIVIILIFGILLLLKLKKQNTVNDIQLFYAKKPLLEIEQLFFYRLSKALPESIVLAKVPLSRFLGVKNGFSTWKWNEQIKRMTIDFLICRLDSSIIAAIELDDSSDNQDKNLKRNKEKDQAIKAAGIVLIKCDIKHPPTEIAFRELVIKLDRPKPQDGQRKSARRLGDRREVEFSGGNEPR